MKTNWSAGDNEGKTKDWKLGGTQSIVRKILEGIRDILKMLIW